MPAWTHYDSAAPDRCAAAERLGTSLASALSFRPVALVGITNRAGAGLRSRRACTLVYMAVLNLSEARAQLSRLLDRIASGEEITITRHGEPAAVILRPDAVRPRRAQETIDRARELGALVEAARSQPLPEAALSPQRAVELVRDVDTGRERP